ncbi:MAG: hypothetical protein HRF43_19815 [Phycisphaerae bacterium]
MGSYPSFSIDRCHMIGEFSRRAFIGGTAVGLAAASGARPEAGPPATRPAAGGPPDTRIRKVFLAKPVPTWPKPDLDLPQEIARLDAELARLAPRMEGIRLEGGDLYRVVNDVPSSAADLGRPDGLLVFNLTSTVGGMLSRLTATGLPTILFSQPYSGHDWCMVPALQQKGHRVMCLATSDYAEIAGACRLIRTMHLLKNTRVLYVNTRPYPKEAAEQIRSTLGPEIVWIGPDRVNDAYRAADASAVEAETRDWTSRALKVIEPSREEIGKAGRLYLALRRIMREEGASAVTINCLGLFAAKVLPAYPCLAFSKLNDLGLTGVCEGDVESTLTQVLFQYAFGVPGFVSDPVVDTASNTVIHAHCVSATRMDGPTGEPAPFIIRSHLEDNAGASLQVKMRVGQVITMAKLLPPETMLISTGTIIDNPDTDRGCRTKITTQVADARKIMRQYGGGLHRVIFYGDRVNAIKDLAGMMKLKVVEEC